MACLYHSRTKIMLSGELPLLSFIRPNRLFTADKKLILYTLGRISDDKYTQVASAITQLIAL